MRVGIFSLRFELWLRREEVLCEVRRPDPVEPRWCPYKDDVLSWIGDEVEVKLSSLALPFMEVSLFEHVLLDVDLQGAMVLLWHLRGWCAMRHIDEKLESRTEYECFQWEAD